MVDTVTLISAIDTLASLKSTDRSSLSLHVKRICVSALFTAQNSTDSNGIIAACRLIMHLSALPNATAYGVVNSSVTSAISNAILKVCVNEIKCVPKATSAPSKGAQKKVAEEEARAEDNEEPNEEIVYGTQVSASQQEEIAMFGAATRAPRQAAKVRASASSLTALAQDIIQHLHVFCHTGEDALECFAECVSGLLFLGAVRQAPEYHFLTSNSIDVCVRLGCVSEKSMTLLYRALMPALVLAARDNKFPDSFKNKLLIHRSAVSVVSLLMHKTAELAEQWPAEGAQASTALPFPALCLVGALQRMAITVTDRAPVRTAVLSSITSLIASLQGGPRSAAAINHFLLFLCKASKSAKVANRAFSLEIATEILNFGWVWSLEEDPPRGAGEGIAELREESAAGSQALVNLVVQRCDDVAPTVRVRAIAGVSDLVERLTADSPPAMAARLLDLALGVSGPNLLELLRLRTLDDRPLVRARALCAYGSALCKRWPKHSPALDGGSPQLEFVTMHLSEEDVTVFMECCNDRSIAVRKQALSSLTSLLLSRPSDSMLQDAWVVAALPLASDGENTVQQKVAQGAYDLMIAPAVQWERAQRKAGDALGAPVVFPVWDLCLRVVASDRTKLLRSAVSTMIRHGLLSSGAHSLSLVLRAVRSACCDRSVSRGSWALMEALLAQSPQVVSGEGKAVDVVKALLKDGSGSTDFVVNCYREKRARHQVYDDEDVRILNVLARVARQVSAEDSAYVGEQLLQLLLSMRCDPPAVSAAIAVKFALSEALHGEGSEECHRDVARWAGAVLSAAYAVLHFKVWEKTCDSNIFEGPGFALSAAAKKLVISGTERGTDSSNNPLLAAIFTVGEIGMVGFSVEDDDNKKSRASTPSAAAVPGYSVSDASNAFRLHMSDRLLDLVQLLMAASLPELAAGTGRPCDNVVRAHAFVTMGKACLRDKERATELVNVFLREIHPSSGEAGRGNTAVRSNALLVLGDLCVRYTSLVERHVGALARCLQDSQVLVRRHALVLLTQLLLQDFLKWRGMLLFRFLATPADSDSEFAAFARTILKTTIKTKFPELLAAHFAEAVVVFNGYAEHPAYIAAAANGSEGESNAVVTMEGVSLDGAARRARRLRLYAMMMEELTEEQKVSVTAKLVQDILSYAVDIVHSRDGKAQQSKQFEDTLEDALLILQSPLLKVGRKGALDDVDDAVDGLDGLDEETSDALASAKSRVIIKLSKQHMMSHVLPVIMSLKAGLEAQRSHLQGALMEYLVFLVKNHKAEVAQAFASDPSLTAEVEYDMRIFEKARAEKAAQRDAAVAALSNSLLDTSLLAPGSALVKGMAVCSASPGPLSPKRAAVGTPLLSSSLKQKPPLLHGGRSFGRTPKEALQSCLSAVKYSEKLASRLFDDADEQDENEPQQASQGARSKRRNWSVAVEGLPEAAPEGGQDEPDEREDEADFFSPVKKRAGKSRVASSKSGALIFTNI